MFVGIIVLYCLYNVMCGGKGYEYYFMYCILFYIGYMYMLIMIGYILKL